MPITLLISWACVTVGSDLPFSQFITVLSDTPREKARLFCVSPAIFRATGKVTFSIAKFINSNLIMFRYGLTVIILQ